MVHENAHNYTKNEDLANAVEKVSVALEKTFCSMDEILELRKQARAEKNWELVFNY